MGLLVGPWASRPSVDGSGTVGDPPQHTTSEDDLTAPATDHHTRDERTPTTGGFLTAGSLAALVGFLLATVAAAYAGVRSHDGGATTYYASLPLPGFAPDAGLFAPVWTVLYVLMAVAAWIVWRRWGWKGSEGALNLWVLQLLLNAAWTPVFFGLQEPLTALIVVVFLLIAVIATINAFWQRSRLAAILMLPYGFWVAYATLLNGIVWWRLS